MSRRAVLPGLAAIAACDATAAPATDRPAVIYPAGLGEWPAARPTGAFGRGATPQIVDRVTVTATTPIVHTAAAWDVRLMPVPGDGPALAVVDNRHVDGGAIEVIDVDAGTVTWRHLRDLDDFARLRHVDRTAIFVGDDERTTAIRIDGTVGWKRDGQFKATGDGTVVLATASNEIAIVDAATGDESTRVAMPANVSAYSIVAGCRDEAWVFDGRLHRLAVAGDVATTAWSIALGDGTGSVVEIDACRDPILVDVLAPSGARSRDLYAVDRTTGRIVGGPLANAGRWPARAGDGVELAVDTGIERWPRSLAAREAWLGDVAAGRLLAVRGDRRLVAGPSGTALLLDRDGVAAYIPGGRDAALGDHHVVSAHDTGAVVSRVALPASRPDAFPHRRPALPAVEAERVALPPPRAIDAAAAIAAPVSADRSLVTIDPADPAIVWIAHRDGLTRVDLRHRTTGVTRNGCGKKFPAHLVASREVVACAVYGDDAEHDLRAVRDGAIAWRWSGPIDALDAAGGGVHATDRDRATAIDAATGEVRFVVRTATGERSLATPIGSLSVAVERGVLVARPTASPLSPVWATTVRGVVTALRRAGDDLAVTVDDVDVYRVDAATGDASALAAHAETIAMSDRDPRIVTALRRPGRLIVRVFDRGGERWRVELAVDTDYRIVEPAALGAPIVVAAGVPAPDQPHDALPGAAIVLDAMTGRVVDHVALPDGARGTLFATVVDGRPTAGAVLHDPLRVVTF